METEADAAGRRLALARRLLAAGESGEARGLLQWLAERQVAEGAYLLGVLATREGRLAEALGWMERAQGLNPGHEETRSQVEGLRRAIAVAAG